MQDAALTQLLVKLAEAIRVVPERERQEALAYRFFALVAHLDERGQVDSAIWRLSSAKKTRSRSRQSPVRYESRQ